jgi:uncharacterized protein YdeI (YjbR/CyaY-like superfamily)
MSNKSQENNQTIEEIILQWQKEFERTTGIQSQVGMIEHDKWTHVIHYLSDEGPVWSYYNKDLFLSAISTLKDRHSLLQELPTECSVHTELLTE